MLRNSTKSELADQYIERGLSIISSRFPGLVSAYVGGSYANDYAIPTSDIDLYLFFDRPIDEKDDQKIADLGKELNFSIELDLIPIHLEKIKRIGKPNFKTSFLHVWGEDISDMVPCGDAAQRAFRGMCGTYERLGLTRKNKPYYVPLDYPKPEEELKGYDWRTLTVAGQQERSIKEIVVLTGWLCTGLINWVAKKDVPTKKHCPIMFKEYFPGGVADAFKEVTNLCRNELHYKVPTDPVQYQKLVEIMPKVLLIENFFLEKFQDFLIEHLDSDDADKVEIVLGHLGEIIYPNNKSLEALKNFVPQNEAQSVIWKDSLAKLTTKVA